MSKIKIGEKYGRWLVITVERVGQYWRAECICDCGNVKSVRQDTLLNGQSTSCGCYSKEVVRKVNSKKGGVTAHPLYQRWYDMNRRCYDSRRKDFHHYGGRGISVCDEWNKYNPQGFVNFIKDMESSYIVGLELDRIDNNSNYCKENCKWSTRSEQVINSRKITSNIGEVHWLSDGEETLHLAAMAKKYGISHKKLQDRIGKLGWSLEDALNKQHRVKYYAIIIEGVSYRTYDIFSTNVSNRGKSLGISTGQMLRALFKNNVDILAMVDGCLVDVNFELSPEETKPFKIKSGKFAGCFKDHYNIEVADDQSL